MLEHVHPGREAHHGRAQPAEKGGEAENMRVERLHLSL
jgi:hypothetical protein